MTLVDVVAFLLLFAFAVICLRSPVSTTKAAFYYLRVCVGLFLLGLALGVMPSSAVALRSALLNAVRPFEFEAGTSEPVDFEEAR